MNMELRNILTVALGSALILLASYADGFREPRSAAAQTLPISTNADITLTGSAQQLVLTGSCSDWQLVALRTNAADVRFGDSNVGASRGEPLAPGASDRMVMPYPINYTAYYLYGQSGDKVSITCKRSGAYQ